MTSGAAALPTPWPAVSVTWGADTRLPAWVRICPLAARIVTDWLACTVMSGASSSALRPA